jgi:hypothetical protein
MREFGAPLPHLIVCVSPLPVELNSPCKSTLRVVHILQPV